MIYTETPKNLPACWLGKTITMKGAPHSMVGKIVTKSMVNPECTCKTEKQAYFCEHGGKLLSCNKTKSKKKGGEAHGKSEGRGKKKVEQRRKSKTQSSVARKASRAGR